MSQISKENSFEHEVLGVFLDGVHDVKVEHIAMGSRHRKIRELRTVGARLMTLMTRMMIGLYGERIRSLQLERIHLRRESLRRF